MRLLHWVSRRLLRTEEQQQQHCEGRRHGGEGRGGPGRASKGAAARAGTCLFASRAPHRRSSCWARAHLPWPPTTSRRSDVSQGRGSGGTPVEDADAGEQGRAGQQVLSGAGDQGGSWWCRGAWRVPVVHGRRGGAPPECAEVGDGEHFHPVTMASGRKNQLSHGGVPLLASLPSASTRVWGSA